MADENRPKPIAAKKWASKKFDDDYSNRPPKAKVPQAKIDEVRSATKRDPSEYTKREEGGKTYSSRTKAFVSADKAFGERFPEARKHEREGHEHVNNAYQGGGTPEERIAHHEKAVKSFKAAAHEYDKGGNKTTAGFMTRKAADNAAEVADHKTSYANKMTSATHQAGDIKAAHEAARDANREAAHLYKSSGAAYAVQKHISQGDKHAQDAKASGVKVAAEASRAKHGPMAGAEGEKFQKALAAGGKKEKAGEVSGIHGHIEKHIAELQANADKEHADRKAKNPAYPDSLKQKFDVQHGPKYSRITRKDEGSKYGGSAHHFIDRTNGNILKAASYKGPAKNFARGNVVPGQKSLPINADAKGMIKTKEPSIGEFIKKQDAARELSKEAHGISNSSVSLHGVGSPERTRNAKAAGEAHLKAAAAHAELGQEKSASEHRESAAKEAKTAGGEWDESKHPRGPDGKFG